MINCSAEFIANNVLAEVKLSSGENIKARLSIEADGNYKSWWEYPSEPQYGQEKFVEIDVDENSIRPLYKDEWEFEDKNKQEYLKENPSAFKNISVKEVVKLLEIPDWEVDEDSLE